MTITTDDVRRVAHLARLGIDEEHLNRYAGELSLILDFVQQLNAAATDDIEPLAHPLETKLRLREDQITEGNRRDDFLPLAPAAQSGMYLVPKVIE